jgi:hypothetical protein
MNALRKFTHLEREYAVEYECVRRTLRYSLAVDIEMTDIKLEIEIRARTKMLSMFGCGVDTVKVLPQGTRVRIKLTHQGAEVRALGSDVNSLIGLGTKTRPGHHLVAPKE